MRFDQETMDFFRNIALNAVLTARPGYQIPHENPPAIYSAKDPSDLVLIFHVPTIKVIYIDGVPTIAESAHDLVAVFGDGHTEIKDFTEIFNFKRYSPSSI